MTGGDARRQLRRLSLADLGKRLYFRLLAWAAAAFLAWSLTLLLAVAIPDASVIGLSARAFHVIVMAAVTALPAFIAAPVPSSAGLAAVRRADRDAAVESWLDYPGGPAAAMLEKGAFEALSIASISGYGSPRRSRAAVIAVRAMAAAGALAFAAAQAVSMRSGYGVSLGWPDKSALDIAVDRTWTDVERYPGIVVPGERLPENAGPGLPGERRYGGLVPEGEEALEQPDFGSVAAEGATGDGEAARSERGERRFEEAGIADAGRSGTDGDSGRTEGGPRSADGAEAAGDRDSSGEARVPGWEGTGRAIDESPLVDYRARLERQMAETTGVETTLGARPSAELVSAAIAEWYASFDAKVAVGRPVDPGLARAMEAWRLAFGDEAVP